jgi:hypothetical protein
VEQHDTLRSGKALRTTKAGSRPRSTSPFTERRFQSLIAPTALGSRGRPPGDVVAGDWLVLDADLNHGVQCTVELSIAVTVQPISGGDVAFHREGVSDFRGDVSRLRSLADKRCAPEA